MKVLAAIFLLFALASAELVDKRMMQFLQLKTQASDAVSTVMDVLNGLKQSALDERSELDEWHDETEDMFATRIGKLQSIQNTHQGIYDAAVANREFVEAEITDTQNYLDWIANRFLEIAANVQELHDERCDASLVFVTRCREVMESLAAVDMLRGELSAWEAAGMPVSLVEIKKMKSFNKLAAFTHLFKANAMESFLALTDEDDEHYGESTRSAEEVGDDHLDNDQGAVELEGFTSDRDQSQTIVEKLMVKLDEFEYHLNQMQAAYIAAEVEAGRNTVAYIQESEKEVHTLQVEQDRKTAYLTKCENDLVLALEHESMSLANLDAAKAAVAEAQAELAAHREFYMSEVERLANDVEVTEAIIKIFLDELAGIDDIMRNQQYDEVMVVDDDRFAGGMFGGAAVNDDAYTGQGGYEAVAGL